MQKYKGLLLKFMNFFINIYIFIWFYQYVKNNNKTIKNEREKQLYPSLHRFDTVRILFAQST